MRKFPVSWLVRAWAMVALLLLLSGPALADPITITNPSFEDGATGWDFSHVPDWNQGVISPGPGEYLDSIPDGVKVAHVTLDGYISQLLEAKIAASTTYTLMVYVGHPDIYPPEDWSTHDPPWSYSVQLRHAATISGVLTSTSDYDPGKGHFGMLTLSYSSGQNPAYVGEHLEIGLMGSGGHTVEFDKVTLDATPVPVPSTVWLMASGLLSLVGWRWKEEVGSKRK